jgi:hypothetical protein
MQSTTLWCLNDGSMSSWNVGSDWGVSLWGINLRLFPSGESGIRNVKLKDSQRTGSDRKQCEFMKNQRGFQEGF